MFFQESIFLHYTYLYSQTKTPKCVTLYTHLKNSRAYVFFTKITFVNAMHSTSKRRHPSKCLAERFWCIGGARPCPKTTILSQIFVSLRCSVLVWCNQPKGSYMHMLVWHAAIVEPA